jgi:hypothetical protein
MNGLRRRARRAWLAPLLAFAVACGSARPSSPPADVAAPYPYSVYQIRAGCPYGRSIEYRIEKAGETPIVERWSFAPVDGETVNVTTETFDAVGNSAGPPKTESAKWAALHEHARFPQSATTIQDETLSLPAGTFDCMRYTVTKGDVVRTYWFARSLPGPPVKLEITKGGTTVMTMTMQANRTR